MSYYDLRILVDSLSGLFNTMCPSTLKAQRSLSSINNKTLMLQLLQQLVVQQERNNNKNNMKNKNNKNTTQSFKKLVVCTHLDNDDAAPVAVAVSMVDNDNEPTPENHPVANETVDDIFSGWSYSGICECRSTNSSLRFPTRAEVLDIFRDRTNKSVSLFEAFFFKDYTFKNTIIPTTNKKLGG